MRSAKASKDRVEAHLEAGGPYGRVVLYEPLMLDKDVLNRTCENTVAEQYELGRRLGVSVTPTIITAGGLLVEGHAGVDDLLSALR